MGQLMGSCLCKGMSEKCFLGLDSGESSVIDDFLLGTFISKMTILLQAVYHSKMGGLVMSSNT